MKEFGMTEYRRGAENIPLKSINKDLPILVMVYDLATDKLVDEVRMNYGDAEDRKHLGRITFYALTHHCSVETIAIIDAEAEYEK
jgi:hypothetical protein